jgi:DNA-directed RNA polymerase subunit RPC12/RpoP
MNMVSDENAIGDVHCLNCGRALAQVVRNQTGGYQLLPTIHQSTVQVIVAGRHLLRCRRCGGRAFVELREETPIEELVETHEPRSEHKALPAHAALASHASRKLGWRVGPRDRTRVHSAAHSLRS